MLTEIQLWVFNAPQLDSQLILTYLALNVPRLVQPQVNPVLD